MSQVRFFWVTWKRQTRFLIAVSSVWHLGSRGPFGLLLGSDEDSLRQERVQKGQFKAADATR